MQVKALKYLDEIRDAASFIQDLVNGRALNDYRPDRALRQAVERNFEIIGEAEYQPAQNDQITASANGEYPPIIDFYNFEHLEEHGVL